MLQDLKELRAKVESITQHYSLKDIVKLKAWHGQIPIKEVIKEPLDEKPRDFKRPLLVAGPPNVGKTCWVVRQAWHWLQSNQSQNADVFLINASQDKPSLVGTLVRPCPSEASVLIVIDDIHFARSNPRPWVDELEKAQSSRLGKIFVVWVARDADLQNQCVPTNLKNPNYIRFPWTEFSVS